MFKETSQVNFIIHIHFVSHIFFVLVLSLRCFQIYWHYHLIVREFETGKIPQKRDQFSMVTIEFKQQKKKT